MATIRKRTSKWQVLIRRTGHPVISRSFFKKADAEEWARFTESQLDRGEMPASPRALDGHTVRGIIERYRDEVSIKKLSHNTEKYILDAFLRTPLADQPLAQVTSSDFSSFREERLKLVKPGTVNRQFQIIKHAFDIAMREWGIPLRENPLEKLKKLKVSNARNRRLESEEWEAIKIAVKVNRNPFIMPLVRLAIETAMRRGELIAMQWQHIDLEARTVFIPVTKNGHARTIPLTSEAVKVLKEIQGMKQADSKRVFPGMTGNSADHAWDRIVERAQIKNLHFHDLRHEAISRFFEMGLSIPEVALISGHRDYKMLFRYTHLKPEDLAKKLH